MVRSTNNNAIQQVVKRMGEMEANLSHKDNIFENKVEFFRGTSQIKYMPFKNGKNKCVIGTGVKNGCFITKNNQIVVVRKIILNKVNNQTKISKSVNIEKIFSFSQLPCKVAN